MRSDRKSSAAPAPGDAPDAPGRRELLKAIASGGGLVAARVLLPAAWSAPIIAAMELPAHAGLSQPVCAGASDEPPGGSVLQSGDFVKATIDGTTHVVEVTVPPSLVANRTPYQVYERETTSYPLGTDEKNVGGSTGNRKGTCVARLVVPSSAPDLSGKVSFKLENRTSNTYEYQLRWQGGHTAWVKATKTGAKP